MFQEPECYYDDKGDFNCKNCLIKSDTFKYLTNKELDLLANNRFQVNYKARDTIFKIGTPITHSISFTEGIAKVFHEDDKGEIILRLIKPTEFINGYGLLYNKINQYSISAITNSSACFIDVDLINNFCDNNRHFREAYISEIQQYNYFVQKRIINLMNRKNPGRVAETLLYLSREVYCSKEFKIDFTRAEFAQLCFTSLDSLNRILGQFSEGNLILNDRNIIKILNANILEKIWQNG